MPPRPDYFPFLLAIQNAVSASVGNFSIALLEHCEQFSLSRGRCAAASCPCANYLTPSTAMMPANPFPTQLNQANVALTHLLNKGIHPSNIVLSGDSAGGNLIIQLGAHILHPLSSISAPPTLTEPLAGGLLISPWNIYNVDAPSYAQNDKKDILDLHSYMFISDIVKRGLDPKLQDYSEPVLAPAGWLKGLDNVYSRFCIVVGEEECPFDQVKETRDILSRYVPDTELVIEPGSAHGEVIYRFATKEGGVGKDWDAIIAFSSKALAGASK